MLPLLDTVVGQELAKRLVVQTLTKTGTIYNFLFFGPDGVGKRRTALLLAKSLLCPAGGCEFCPTCQQIDLLNFHDFLLIAPLPAKTPLPEKFILEETYKQIRPFSVIGESPELGDRFEIRIRQIEALQERLRFRPLAGARRVVVLLDADRMNKEAANRFLKTLEEPPADTYFVLTTSRLYSVIPTIRSRCQLVPFRYLKSAEVRQVWELYTGAEENAAFNDFGLGSVSESALVNKSKYLDPALEIFRRSPLNPAAIARLIDGYEKKPVAELVYILLILYRAAMLAKLGQKHTSGYAEAIEAKAKNVDLKKLVVTGQRLNNALFEVGRNPNKKLFLASLLSALS